MFFYWSEVYWNEVSLGVVTLAADNLYKYFKHVYLKCGNLLIFYNHRNKWWSRNLAYMLKIPKNWVPWTLLNKVPHVPKCLDWSSTSSTRVSWVPEFLECLKCQSASSTRVFWVLECFSTRIPKCLQSVHRECLQSARTRQNFVSLLVLSEMLR